MLDLLIVRIASLVAERHIEGAPAAQCRSSGPSDAASAFPLSCQHPQCDQDFFEYRFRRQTGNLRCAAVWDDRAINLSDRAYFKEALTASFLSVNIRSGTFSNLN
jgi:hypothetical protein